MMATKIDGEIKTGRKRDFFRRLFGRGTTSERNYATLDLPKSVNVAGDLAEVNKAILAMPISVDPPVRPASMANVLDVSMFKGSVQVLAPPPKKKGDLP